MIGVLKTPRVDLIKHRGLPPGMKRSMGRSGWCWGGHRDKAESLPCGESIVNFVIHVAAFQELIRIPGGRAVWHDDDCVAHLMGSFTLMAPPSSPSFPPSRGYPEISRTPFGSPWQSRQALL